MVRSHLRRARARLRRGEGCACGGRARAPRSPHPPVVPDALEEVQSLLQAVGLVVLPNDHVVAAAGHHEDDGGHICGAGRAKAARERRRRPPHSGKARRARGAAGPPTVEALDPLAALIALATHVEHAAGAGERARSPAAVPARAPRPPTREEGPSHLLEVDFVHLELGLKDPRGQDAAAKQVLEQKPSQRPEPQWPRGHRSPRAPDSLGGREPVLTWSLGT